MEVAILKKTSLISNRGLHTLFCEFFNDFRIPIREAMSSFFSIFSASFAMVLVYSNTYGR
jgi:hypothetical protein